MLESAWKNSSKPKRLVRSSDSNTVAFSYHSIPTGDKAMQSEIDAVKKQHETGKDDINKSPALLNW